ncbi:Uncharacterised protein [uncultured Roseburia sp.]|uniref:DAPG hydrolase PhiG domain-containing protein n=1 Tax=Brotonthovivens ammoniilytica TaxID=2981725 RepID=A0ABT2TKF7_9FIRM|nr:hypothetical protein [Brotonthovivens ammoniilytica]MCU6762311.1 hypothetical protein [Brotonthovivens ammoniilytica]SCI67538.1 Uncharacterised protein [uncultured Roseburia sp.]
MRFRECDALLNRKSLVLETGVERLESGGMHVAVRMCLENCTAEMLEWWFGSECDTDGYRLWHPGAHKYSTWGEYEPDHVPGNVIGTTHFIRESLGASEVMEMQLKYLDPRELFGEKLDEAKARGDADVVLYGWACPGKWDEISRNEKGYPAMMQYVGVGRNTAYGLVLRNHYWLGDEMNLPREEIEKMVSEEFALYLMEHDSNEFHILGKAIPPCYLRDNWEKLGAPEPYSVSDPKALTLSPKLFA